MDDDSVEEFFSKGVALGRSDVMTDTVEFRFRDERYSFPTISTVGIATWNGNYYTAKVEKLRKLKQDIDERWAKESARGQ